MRNIYLRLFAALVLLPVFGGCSDFTDITPKGQSILNKVEELELLLNDEYMQLQSWEPMYLLNDNIPPQNVIELISRHEEGIPSVESVVVWSSMSRVTVVPREEAFSAMARAFSRAIFSPSPASAWPTAESFTETSALAVSPASPRAASSSR